MAKRLPANRTPGAFLRIRLGDASFAYGRALRSPYVAFYDLQTDSPLEDPGPILRRPLLFTVAVVHERPWDVIGVSQLEPQFLQPIRRFRQDLMDPEDIAIVDEHGKLTPATRQEVSNLERDAVWSATETERRLLDTFKGVPNVTVELLRVDKYGSKKHRR